MECQRSLFLVFSKIVDIPMVLWWFQGELNSANIKSEASRGVLRKSFFCEVHKVYKKTPAMMLKLFLKKDSKTFSFGVLYLECCKRIRSGVFSSKFFKSFQNFWIFCSYIFFGNCEIRETDESLSVSWQLFMFPPYFS